MFSHTPDRRPITKVSKKQIKEKLLATFGMQCQGCYRSFDHPEYLTLDHIRPKSDGGANDISNLTLLCHPCNKRKSNQLTLSGLRAKNEGGDFMESGSKPGAGPSGLSGKDSDDSKEAVLPAIARAVSRQPGGFERLYDALPQGLMLKKLIRYRPFINGAELELEIIRIGKTWHADFPSPDWEDAWDLVKYFSNSFAESAEEFARKHTPAAYTKTKKLFAQYPQDFDSRGATFMYLATCENVPEVKFDREALDAVVKDLADVMFFSVNVSEVKKRLSDPNWIEIERNNTDSKGRPIVPIDRLENGLVTLPRNGVLTKPDDIADAKALMKDIRELGDAFLRAEEIIDDVRRREHEFYYRYEQVLESCGETLMREEDGEDHYAPRRRDKRWYFGRGAEFDNFSNELTAKLDAAYWMIRARLPEKDRD